MKFVQLNPRSVLIETLRLVRQMPAPLWFVWGLFIGGEYGMAWAFLLFGALLLSVLEEEQRQREITLSDQFHHLSERLLAAVSSVESETDAPWKD